MIGINTLALAFQHMSSCELCGADNVSTKRIPLDGALVEGCKQCQAKMGFNAEQNKTVENIERASKKSSYTTSGGYGGLGTEGKDIMVRDSKQLVSDFATLIKQAREARGWDQRTLAQNMKEKINMIQRTESGQRPNDELIKKFERFLDITLFSDSIDIDYDKTIGNKDSRTLSLGDMIKMARQEED